MKPSGPSRNLFTHQLFIKHLVCAVNDQNKITVASAFPWMETEHYFKKLRQEVDNMLERGERLGKEAQDKKQTG